MCRLVLIVWMGVQGRADALVGLCVLGPNPFGSSLDQVVQGKTLANRAFAVHEIRGCPAATIDRSSGSVNRTSISSRLCCT
jgi:hypothetical protein